MQTVSAATERSARDADVLAIARLSPVRIAAKDRQAWLDLFTADAVVQDPVGAAFTLKSDGGLERFYDTLIAPNPVHFDVHQELVQDEDALRYVTIHTQLSPTVTGEVRAYLLYRTRLDGDVRRIESLHAHWLTTEIKYGGSGVWKPAIGQLVRMFRGCKLPWVWAYLTSALRGVGAAGVRHVQQLSAALKAGDTAAFSTCFAEGAQLRFGDRTLDAAGLFAKLGAGSELSFEHPVAAGWTTTASFRVAGATPAQGVVIFEHVSGERRIRSARFFVA